MCKAVVIVSIMLHLPVFLFSQGKVTVSGMVRDQKTKTALPFVNIVLRSLPDSALVAGAIGDESGRFSLTNIAGGEYLLACSYAGYKEKRSSILVGNLSAYLDLGAILLEANPSMLGEVTVVATSEESVSRRMDKKTFSLSDNLAQAGGSVLQAVRNLPGVTVNDEGKIEIRGSDKAMILIDGKQTALSGIGSQQALDNIPASAIEKVEIITNPSARYDAAGSAGIINLIYKKEKNEGFNGKVGIAAGAGALWEKKESLPGIRPQYRATPKVNPSLSLNYRTPRLNAFLQGDYLYNKTLNKNEFATRFYNNGDTIRHQVKRNRITTVGTGKAGFDYFVDDNNSLTLFGLFSSEYVRDHGDIPYYDDKLTVRRRLWPFTKTRSTRQRPPPPISCINSNNRVTR